ncbi:glycosyltransferase [Streptomyces sp. NPDC000404]
MYGYPPDHNAGSEWMLHSMLRPLAERGHRVEVWLSHPGKTHKSYEIDGVYVVPFQEGIDFVARAHRADVLVTHYENVPLLAGLARERAIPLTVICHDNFAASFHNAAGADLVVYNSEWIRRDGEIYYARYPPEFLPRRSIVVRPPVIADEYRTRPGECATLVNLNADKGGELFWRIAAWTPEWKFRGVRGAYGEQVMPPPRLPNCEVVDSVPGQQMREHVYSRARVMLMPSLYESWGRVAVEAFASGIPVIAHPTPGLVEAMGAAGIFAYRDDQNAWIDALRSLRDPDTWARASRRALERSAELSAAHDLDLWCEAIESLEGNRRHAASAGRTVPPSADAGPAGPGPEDDRAVGDGTPAEGRPRLSPLSRVRRAFGARPAAGRTRSHHEPEPPPSTGAGTDRAPAEPTRSGEPAGEPDLGRSGTRHGLEEPQHTATDAAGLQRKDGTP